LLSAIEGTVSAIGEALSPVVTTVTEWLTEVSGKVTEFVQENAGLASSIGMASVAVIGLGVGLAILGPALIAVGGAMSIVGATFSMLVGAVGLLSSAIGALGAMFGALPLVAVGAGLATLATYTVTTTNVIGKSVSWLGQQFDALKSTALIAFDGIKAALAAGDIGAAAKIMWLGLKVVWAQGLAELGGMWAQAWATMQHVFVDVKVSLEEAWRGLILIFTDIFDGFVNFWKTTWNDVTTWTAKQWTRVVGFFDDSIDVEGVVEHIERENQKENDRIHSDTNEKRNKELDAVAALKAEHTKKINDELVAGYVARAKELQLARDQLKNAVAEAKIKAAQREDEATTAPTTEGGVAAPEMKQPEVPTMEKVAEGIKQVMPAMAQQVQQAFEAAGSFNAAAAGRLGFGSNLQQRTVDATEQTARNTQKMLNEMREGGAQFA
jgi:hypothetical protein